MFRSLTAGLVIVSMLAPVRTFAWKHQPSVQLDESSAAKWVGKSVEIRLVTGRFILGRVESLDADALMLREASGSARRVPYADVAGIGKTGRSDRLAQVVIGVAFAAGTLLYLWFSHPIP